MENLTNQFFDRFRFIQFPIFSLKIIFLCNCFEVSHFGETEKSSKGTRKKEKRLTLLRTWRLNNIGTCAWSIWTSTPKVCRKNSKENETFPTSRVVCKSFDRKCYIDRWGLLVIQKISVPMNNELTKG